MTFADKLVAARSHLIFIAALLSASFIILAIEDHLVSLARARAPAAGGVMLDLGTAADAMAAAQAWPDLIANAPALAGASLVIRPREGNVGLSAGPLPDDRASTACEQLRAAGRACRVSPAA